MSRRRFRVAAAAYPIDRLADWRAYERKLSDWVARGAEAGAALLAFPEYGAMELAAFAGTDDLQRQLDHVSALAPEVDALHVRLAQAHGVHILAASLPSRSADGAATNRARLIAPNGAIGVQDKHIMTRWERDVWGVVGAAPLRLFETELGKIGVLICYDVEFPLLARALAEAGAEILLVPSCTDAETGYWRVRIGAMARALEGQCCVVMASTVGAAPWSEAIDHNVGAGGVFVPSDRGFPATGVLASGRLNAPGWTTAEIDRDLIADIRADGEVLIASHWPEQTARLASPVERETLTPPAV